MDPKGQFIILHASVHGVQILLASVYSPVTAAVFTDLSTKLSSLSIYPTILVGDFNSVLQPALDRLKPSMVESRLFLKWCEVCRSLALEISY